MKLNLGCGDDIKKGYVNIDVRNLPGVNIVGDVCNLPFEKNSIDEILALDVYEHVSYLKSQVLLIHWVSLLKPGGLLFIQAPCINKIIQEFLNVILESGDITHIESLIAAIFGAQDYIENTHYTICHPELMYIYLKRAGIKGNIEKQFNGTNIKIRAWK